MTVPSQFTSLRGFIVYSHMYSHSGYTQMFLCVSVFDVDHMQPVSSLSCGFWFLQPVSAVSHLRCPIYPLCSVATQK